MRTNLTNDHAYDLCEAFDVDAGELRGLSQEECFALGVEWALFRQKLLTGRPFVDLCIKHNAARLVKMAERHGRYVEDRPSTTPGWSEVWVGDQRL
jgi:hypothetical protein